MTLQDETTLFPDPEPSDDAPETPRLRDRVREALERESTEDLVALLDPLPNSEAVRQLFMLDGDDRDLLLSLLPVELAARLIEEAPHAAATELLDQLPRSGAQVATIRAALTALVTHGFGGEVAEAGQAAVIEAQRAA